MLLKATFLILTISIMYIKKVNKNNSNISLLQGYLFFNVFPPEFPRLIVLKLIQTLKLIYMFVLADVLRKIDLTNGDQDDQNCPVTHEKRLWNPVPEPI